MSYLIRTIVYILGMYDPFWYVLETSILSGFPIVAIALMAFILSSQICAGIPTLDRATVAIVFHFQFGKI